MMNQAVDKDQAATFAEEAFVVDVQSFLHHMMEEKGMSRADLAKAMGVSRARVSQIFSDEAKNFTVRLLARAAHAMGERIDLSCELLRACKDTDLAPLKVEVAQSYTGSNVISLWAKMNDFDDCDYFACQSDERLESFVSLSAGLAEAA